MGSDVKRAYDSRVRDAQAHATRERILAAARGLVLDRGYRGATVAAIALAADVHVDTIYATVGRKPDLVRELVERGLSGTDHPVPAAEREYVAAIRATDDPAEKIDIYAAATRSMLERTAGLFVALRDAAATDDAARALVQEFGDRRAANMRLFVADVAAPSGLRDGLAVDDAADTVWATNSPEMFVLLTRERGWSGPRYQSWLGDTWRRLLLP